VERHTDKGREGGGKERRTENREEEWAISLILEVAYL